MDAVGRPVRLSLTEGQVHDSQEAPELLRGLRKAYVLADRAYDSNALRAQLRSQRCRVVIPSNPSRKRKRPFDRRLYKLRHLVENFFQRIKRYRRIAMRYEKLSENFEALLWMAATLIWLR